MAFKAGDRVIGIGGYAHEGNYGPGTILAEQGKGHVTDSDEILVLFDDGKDVVNLGYCDEDGYPDGNLVKVAHLALLEWEEN